MKSLDRYIEAFAHLPEGITEAEVNLESHSFLSMTMEDGKVVDTKMADQLAYYLRVSGEKTGLAYTQNPDEDIERLLRKALENSEVSDSLRPIPIHREKCKTVYRDQTAIRDPKELTGALAEIIRETQEKVRALTEEPIQLGGTIRSESYGQHTVNSWGWDAGFEAPVYHVFLYGMETERNHGGIDVELTVGDLKDLDLDYAARNMIDRLRWLRDPVGKFESGDYPVILSEIAAYTLFATAWQEFSGLKFKSKGSCMTDLFGKQIAPECVTISDEPEGLMVQTKEGKRWIPGMPMLCDAEGSEGRSFPLIDKGCFNGLFHTLESAQWYKENYGQITGPESERMPENIPSGNGGRRPLLFGSIMTEMLITPKNFCIHPGNSSLKEMEEHMGDGVLITEYMDIFHTLDLVSGDFSAPCFGVRIRNGKEAENLTALTVSGNIKTLLSEIEEIGNTMAFHPMTALQSYSIGTPAIRVKSLNVSGEE